METYPDGIGVICKLMEEFAEDMENSFYRLKRKEEEMAEKIKAFMGMTVELPSDFISRLCLSEPGVTAPGAAELARQALEGGAPQGTPEKPRYWDEKTRTWTDAKPNGELELF
jgi:hypothetical protein